MIRLALFLALALCFACGSPVDPLPPQCGDPVTAPVTDMQGTPVTTATITYCIPSRP